MIGPSGKNSVVIEAPRRLRQGTDFALAKSSAKPIFDPFLFIFFVLANPAASYGEYARRIQVSLSGG
jgi:hypothetical protein